MVSLPEEVKDIDSATAFINGLPGLRVCGLNNAGQLDVEVTGKISHETAKFLVEIGKVLQGRFVVPVIDGATDVSQE